MAIQMWKKGVKECIITHLLIQTRTTAIKQPFNEIAKNRIEDNGE